MSSRAVRGLHRMTDTKTPTTLHNIGVAMFTVADVDAAIAFYTEKIGFELRSDVAFGESGENRWVEVAPKGSTARLALNPPMEGVSTPGGSAIGIETDDVLGEHARLAALGLEVGPTPQQIPRAPLLFMLSDPDGNHLAIVETPPAA
ncbi:VOC family protein [Patulibacter minatonensis]|uniref:VOC family protein n=1 Tax=Patulibacter minatonensis TaxID=298163 RepID=UPI0004BA0000|nr:VOC family protein [Patulibacter minatonensis]